MIISITELHSSRFLSWEGKGCELPDRCWTGYYEICLQMRRHFLERRGEGVGIILSESEALSGKIPVYEVFDEELRLTIFAAKPPWQAEV